MVPVIVRGTVLEKLKNSPLELIQQSEDTFMVRMNGDHANSANNSQNEDMDGVGRRMDRESPIDNSWPKYSRHGNPSSPLHSNSSTAGVFKESPLSGTPPLMAGAPTDFKIAPPYNKGPARWRHHMRPDTSLPFDKDVGHDADDFISELHGSFSRPPDGAFAREKAMRTKTALKLEGDQDMTSFMMEKYMDIPSNRVVPIKHHDAFTGFRNAPDPYDLEECLHSTESILISSDPYTEDESEFEIPSGNSHLPPETSSVAVQVNTIPNGRNLLETDSNLEPIRTKMHKNRGTWSLN